MKKYSRFILVLALFFYSRAFSSENVIQFIKIKLSGKSQDKIQELSKLNLDIAYQNKYDGYIEVFVDATQIKKIEKLGLSSETIIPDMKAFGQKLRDSNYFDPFHSYEEIVSEIQQSELNNPGIVKSQSIGKSWEGRDIWAVKISDNVTIDEPDEAEVLFMANIHAREMITPEIIMYFMDWLIDNYNIDPRATDLVNHRQIWLIPTINPDGRVYVFTGNIGYIWSGENPIAWRKNKRDNNNNNQFDYSYDGVDLNRNFGYEWGLDSGSSGDPGDETYRGPESFSEPETQAIKNFVTSHYFVISLSYHSYGRWWIFPWGYTNFNPDTPDHAQFVALADSCTAYNRYTPANGDDFSYLVSGDSDDWLYGEQTTKNKIFAFTPEVGSAAEGYFWPDTSLIPKLVEENMGPNIFLAYAAGEEPIIEHAPLTETEDPGPYTIIATIKPPILLTFPVPLANNSFKLFYKPTEVAQFDSVIMYATGNPDEYTADIPALSSTKIHYYIAASDQKRRTGTLPQGAPMASFSFKIGTDLEAPNISHSPYAFSTVHTKVFVINAIVTDNIGISSVRLFYRKNNSALDSLDMRLTAVPNEYQAMIIPTELKAGDFYDYQIIAIDNSKRRNSARLPASGYYRFYIKNSILYDFETESSFTPIGQGDWQWGIPTSGPNSSHSGSKVWATILSGNYHDLTESILETPPISLAQKDSAKLTFWHWYVNEFADGIFWDGGNIKISVDGEAFQIITPDGGYDGIIDPFNNFLANEPCFGGIATNGNFWHQEVFDLTPYVHHTVKIRFHFGSDQAGNEPGWYIDDVEMVFNEPAPVAENDLPDGWRRSFDLSQNYPNPFNPATTINYTLAQPGEVRLEIYDLLGQRVRTLVHEHQAAGAYSVFWQGKDEADNEISTGVYLYRLMFNHDGVNKVFIRKMVKLE